MPPRVLITPCPSAVTVTNRPVNSAFAPKSKTCASTTMARVRHAHSFCVKPSPASSPASKSSRTQNTPRPQCPSSTHMPSLFHPRTRPPPVVIHHQVSPSLHLNPQITSVSVPRMRVYHSISRLTLRHALSISLTASTDGLLFSSFMGAQCESYPRMVLSFGADTANRTDAFQIPLTACS
jgi:hypothetical protein